MAFGTRTGLERSCLLGGRGDRPQTGVGHTGGAGVRSPASGLPVCPGAGACAHPGRRRCGRRCGQDEAAILQTQSRVCKRTPRRGQETPPS